MQFLKKTMENMRKHRDMKLVTTERRRNFLMLTPKLFKKKSINNRNEKGTDTYETQDYLGLSILELRKILMREFWYDFVKPKYSEKTKFCCTDTDVLLYT